MDRRFRRELIGRLVRDARRIASQFALEYRSIEAERANVKSRYGICYDDGTIKIRLTHAVSGQPLKYSSLVSTLCHELAHLRYFDHNWRFKSLYHEMLEWSRHNGIYRPGRLEPIQGSKLARAQPELPAIPLIRTAIGTALGIGGIGRKEEAGARRTRASTGRGREPHVSPPRQLELFG